MALITLVVNGRSATEAEIALGDWLQVSLAEQGSTRNFTICRCPVVPEQANTGLRPHLHQKKWLHSTLPHQYKKHIPAAGHQRHQFKKRHNSLLRQEAAQFKRRHTAAASEAPVQEAPQFAAAPEAPHHCCARGAPVLKRCQFGLLHQRHQFKKRQQIQCCTEAPVFALNQTASNKRLNKAIQTRISTSPGSRIPTSTLSRSTSTRSSLLCANRQFGIATGYWIVPFSALKRPSTEYNTKLLSMEFCNMSWQHLLDLATFFTASGFTGGYGNGLSCIYVNIDFQCS